MDSGQVELITRNVDETIELGRLMGAGFVGGEIVSLVGQLGTGKTHFIKGLAVGLDVGDSMAVTSPTFTLINEYEGRLMLYHVDAYRLKGSEQLGALGFDEFCCGDTVVVVEWADRVKSLVDSYEPISIYLEHCGKNERKIRLENLPNEIKKAILGAK